MIFIKKERLILKVLYHIDNSYDLNKEVLEMDFETYANFLLDMKKAGLIDGVSVLYADDIIYNLNTEKLSITIYGIEYFKGKFSIEIQNNILEILYAKKFETALSKDKIRRELFMHLHHKELESHLRILINMGLIGKSTKTMKGLNVGKQKTEPYKIEEYYINEKGSKYLENGFRESNNRSPLQQIATDVAQVVGNTSKIASGVETTNTLLLSLGDTLSTILNAMGSQHQQSIRMQIENNKLLEQLLEIMQSKEENKEDKIKSFLSGLAGDVAVTLISESAKKWMGIG